MGSIALLLFTIAVPTGAYGPPACIEEVQPPAPADGDRGRLELAWRQTIQREMQTFDDVMHGRRAAYEATVTIDERRFGPFIGVVGDEGVTLKLRHHLYNEGIKNHSIGIYSATEGRSGSFVVQLGYTQIACDDCLERINDGLPDRVTFERERKFIVMYRPGGIPDPRGPVLVPIDARIELRRLRPAEIDLRTANRLFDWFQSSERILNLVRPQSRDIFVTIAAPKNAAAYPHCEATFVQPPEIDLDMKCPGNWSIRFPDQTLRQRCCESPIDHGPGRCTPQLPNRCIEP